MTSQTQYVTLGAAGEVYGAPIETVQEILDVRPIARLPKMADHLLGMIDLRGETIPVLDFRSLLGLPMSEDSHSTRIIVMKRRDEQGETVFAIRADGVYEVTELDEDRLEPPTLNGRWRAPCIAGIGRRSGNFVTVLNFDELLGDEVPGT